MKKRLAIAMLVMLLFALPTMVFAQEGTAEFSFGGFFTAIFMGLITFFTPCVLPVVPAYISYISGLSLGQLTGKEQSELSDEEKKTLRRANRKKMIINSLFFMLGVIIVYLLIGAVFGLLGMGFSPTSPIRLWIFRVLGFIVVLFGIHMTGLIRIPFLDYIGGGKGGGQKGKGGSVWSSFLMGLTFAFAFSSCTAGFFGSIAGMAMYSGNVVGAMVLLTAFGLGVAIPFVITAIAVDALFNFFEKVKKHMKVIEIIGGILLIALGILMILDKIQAVLSF